MSRRRSLSTDISTDDRVAQLSEFGFLPALLYTWAIPHADDSGLITANARQFRMLVCPGLEVTTEQVEVALQQIASVGLWALAQVDGRAVYAFPISTWYKYQNYIPVAKRRTEGETSAQTASETALPQNPAKPREMPQNPEDPRETPENAEEGRETPPHVRATIARTPSPSPSPSLSFPPPPTPQPPKAGAASGGDVSEPPGDGGGGGFEDMVLVLGKRGCSREEVQAAWVELQRSPPTKPVTNAAGYLKAVIQRHRRDGPTPTLPEAKPPETSPHAVVKAPPAEALFQHPPPPEMLQQLRSKIGREMPPGDCAEDDAK